MQDGHTFADTTKNNDIIEAFYTCEKSGLLVKKCIWIWKQWSWLLGCMWWWKSVKLMIGMCSMQLCLSLIAHQYRRSWEDPGIVKMLRMMMMEYDDEKSFCQFSNNVGYCIMLDMMDELFWGLTQRVRSHILTGTKAPQFSLGRWGKGWKRHFLQNFLLFK